MQAAELVPAAAVEAEEGEVVRACVEGHCEEEGGFGQAVIRIWWGMRGGQVGDSITI